MQVFWLLAILLGCTHQVKIVAPKGPMSREAHEARSTHQMAATQGEGATQAALSMFSQGGNIIDAFVAASFAISVERPHSTGLGGGGFLLFYNKIEQKVYSFDFREVAPLAATSAMFLNKNGDPTPLLSQEGSLSVAVPGLVRGLYKIHQRFGKLPWKDTIIPAIKLASNGFPVYDHLHEAIKDRRHLLMSDSDAKTIFFTDLGEPLHVGDWLYQEKLAKTLELIAQEGEKPFYEGKIAKAIIKTVQSKRGLLTLRDLKNYQMKERIPVTGNFHGVKIFSMPPPSSGGIHVIQILKMLEHLDLKSMGPQSADAVHFTALAMQRAFLDRSLYLGDPDFNSVPVKELLDENYLKQLAQNFDSKKVSVADDLRPVKLPYESSDTTHFSLADEEGNMVASTQTINGWFGSGVMARGTGIVLNNEMDDFAQKVGAQNLFGAVGGDQNLVAPMKRPLSSMSPTILIKNNEALMSLGSPSGTRIISCVAQTILNSLEFGMPLYEAVAATRIHQQWRPDELKIESPHLDPNVEKELLLRGHHIVHGNLGCSIQAIKKVKKGWVGVSDPRGVGLAKGL